MTQTPNKSELPIYDFSTTPEQRAEEQAKMDAAIQVAQLEASLKKQEAPVVKSMKAKAKGIVPTKKATPKATKKAGRVVGISADENKFLYELLQAVLYDNNYATMISDSQIAFDKLIARYNNK